MKKLIYAVLIGSLALVGGVQAENEKPAKAQKGRAVHNAGNMQRGGGAARVRSQQNLGAVRRQQQNAFNAAGRQSRNANQARRQSQNANQVRRQNNRDSVATQAKINAASQNNAARYQRNNGKFARGRNNGVQNYNDTNVQRNINAERRGNRQRNVAIVNNWRGSRYSGARYAAFRNYRRERHDRDWYHRHYNRFTLFGGGYYYWNNGYWFPAWGYNSGYNYGYDGPIYGYNDLDPQQVVVSVQERLQRQGYYDGSIDGSLGPITRGALAAYQSDQGLAITSAIDQPTLATLGLI
ncbi:MAG: peptidoglycan-binding protein [Chthoniobacterales bacterium]